MGRKRKNDSKSGGKKVAVQKRRKLNECSSVRSTKQRSVSIDQSSMWVQLKTVPKNVLWPVMVVKKLAGDVINCYCKSDDAYFTVPLSCTKPFPGDLNEIKELGLALLTKKRMISTKRCLLADIDWALKEIAYEASEKEKKNEDNGEELENEAIGEKLENDASGEEIANEDSEEDLEFEASGIEIENKASGEEIENEASGEELENKASRKQIDNKASEEEKGNEASGEEPENEASEEKLENEASGEEIENEDNEEEKENEASEEENGASGEELENEASGEKLENDDSEEEIENEDSEEDLEFEASGKEMKNKASGEEIGNEVSREELENEASGEELENKASRKEISRKQIDNKASEEEKGNEASGEEPENEASEEKLENEASGEEIENEDNEASEEENGASGEELENEASGEKLENDDSEEEIENEDSEEDLEFEASGKEMKNKASGEEIGNEVSREELENEASGEELENKASRKEIQNKASRKQINNEAREEEKENEASEEEKEKEASGEELENEASREKLENEASGEPENEASGEELENDASEEEIENEDSGEEKENEVSEEEKENEASGEELENVASEEEKENEASGEEIEHEDSEEDLEFEASGKEMENKASGEQLKIKANREQIVKVGNKGELGKESLEEQNDQQFCQSDVESDFVDDSDSDEDILQIESDRIRKCHRLMESEITRDCNNPGIFIRKIRKSAKCSKAQSAKKKNGNTRVYDNFHACLYCGLLRQHIKTHLATHKIKEPEVRELLQQKNPDITRVRKEGDHKHNCEVLGRGFGELILSRRPNTLDVNKFGPCPNCHEWILLKNIRLHYKECVKKKTKLSKRQLIMQSQVLAGIISTKPSKLMLNEVFPSMLTDEIGTVAKEDELIVALGESWLRRSIDNKEKRRHYTSQHMRLMARMLIELRRIDRENDKGSQRVSFTDFLETRYFDCFISAALVCSAPYMDDIEDLRSPSNGIKIKYDLGRMVSAKWALLVKDDPHSEKGKEMDTFHRLIAVEWGEKIVKLSRSVMVRRQFTLRKELPSPTDIQALTKHVVSELKTVPLITDNFFRVVQLTETRLLMYNKRRSGEIEAIGLVNFAERSKNLNDLDESLVGELTEVEKYLIKSQDLMRVRGKGNRPVPVLIPGDAKKPLEFISSKQNRREAKIPDGNIYLFPSSGLSCARAYDALKKTCGECTLQAPGRITSVSMRKYTATLTQMLNLDKYQVEWLCSHLGHTGDVHKAYYRQMSGLVERVQVSKIFLLQDMNLSSQFKGKRLEDIDLTDIIFRESEESEDPQEDSALGPVQQLEHDQFGDEVDPIVFEDNGSSDEDNTEMIQPEPEVIKRKKKPVCRQRWDSNEINELNKYFKQYLESGICPRTKAVEEAKKLSKRKNGKIWKRSNDKIIKKISNMNHKN